MAWPTLDWSRPWFAPYRQHGEAVSAAVATGQSLVAALNARLDAAPQRIALPAGLLRFVPMDALPTREPYEAFIARTACVPTREAAHGGLHDFFNALVWLHFPHWKQQLNQLHAEAIAQQTPGARRGALRDALTVFDESGALLDAPPDLRAALHRRDWRALYIEARGRWDSGTCSGSRRPDGACLTVFGHAVLEKLARGPYKAITAQVWTGGGVPWPSAAALCGKPFHPLPVLGVPGWWPANADPAFYDDPTVFRPLAPALKETPGCPKFPCARWGTGRAQP